MSALAHSKSVSTNSFETLSRLVLLVCKPRHGDRSMKTLERNMGVLKVEAHVAASSSSGSGADRARAEVVPAPSTGEHVSLMPGVSSGSDFFRSCCGRGFAYFGSLVPTMDASLSCCASAASGAQRLLPAPRARAHRALVLPSSCPRKRSPEHGEARPAAGVARQGFSESDISMLLPLLPPVTDATEHSRPCRR